MNNKLTIDLTIDLTTTNPTSSSSTPLLRGCSVEADAKSSRDEVGGNHGEKFMVMVK